MPQRDPTEPVVDALLRSLAPARTLDEARAPLAAMLALLDEARAYVTDPPASLDLVRTAAQDILDGRGDIVQLTAVWSALARDLSLVESAGDSRDVQVAWATWHLARALIALSGASSAIACVRARDLTRCVFRAMTWDAASPHEDPTMGTLRRNWETGRLVVDDPASPLDPETLALRSAVAQRMLDVVQSALRA